MIDFRSEDKKSISAVLSSPLEILTKVRNSGFKNVRLIISTSSFPRVLSDHIKTGALGRIPRTEIEVWKLFYAKYSNDIFGLGDYGTVSPEYVEVPPHIFNSIMTAKAVYTELDSFFISRGKKIEIHGNKQYRQIAQNIIKHANYRGIGSSHGDSEINRISNATSSKFGNNGSWLGISINSHLSFILNNFF